MTIKKCKTPVLMAGESYHNANMYYATRFLSGDEFIYLCADDKEYIMLTDFEKGRAQQQSRVKNIITFNDYSYLERVKKSGDRKAEFINTIVAMLSDRSVRNVDVPDNFPLYLADGLRKKGIRVNVAEIPFLENREVKTAEEINMIRQAQAVNEKAMAKAAGMIKKSVVKKGILYYKDEPLTSELLSSAIDMVYLKNGYDSRDNIVASGPACADPHFAGAGPVRANEPIIIDIYPCSKQSRYCGDMTRTFVKGKPSAEVKKMYRLVQEAQELAIDHIKPGVTGKHIHEIVCEFFEKNGYGTQRTGSLKGFIHGTGHSIGLDIHESPGLNMAGIAPLKQGNVVTVEPGLYDPEIGGVRIEDIVVVTAKGCENLNKYPKELIL